MDKAMGLDNKDKDSVLHSAIKLIECDFEPVTISQSYRPPRIVVRINGTPP